MYVLLDIEIRPQYALDDDEMDRFSRSMRKVVDEFDIEFNKYRVRRRHYYSYKIKNTDEDYERFMEFHETYKRKLDIVVYAYTEYEEQDYVNAVAFELRFKNQCYYYDEGYDCEKYDCMKLESAALGQWYPMSPIYIKLPTKTRKAFDRMEGANTPALENYISPKLYEYLISCGISAEYFKEAYKKGKEHEIVAYRLWGREHVLPAESFFPFNKDYDDAWCYDPDTGYVKWVRDEDDDGEDMEHWEFCFNGQLEPLFPIITKKGVEALTYVNDSFEAMGNIRSTIISPKLFDLIQEKVPSVMKYTIPIFLGEPPEYIKAPVAPWKGEYD
ncbi:hypothetical protein NIA71_11500 [Ihubacter massiliensis]|uniref:Uncharacterized protein n=1 Tax=Hominibacterium faecale TaxID=2839743 RepID=A0A9J6QVM2_9FIRM|nr:MULTISPECIES: hypothetical protein [Eubacteriales Family XIII. Incertae Sedis]MCO7122567.1 hypothetical protein [Ihubacter massiliensis]MCU7376842.1 hypothetical protein [Hominibacterium faecale]MCU7379391.1 hypothetical protein [Hominibacterium faecale]